MRNCYVMCGPIACGKSSLASWLSEHHHMPCLLRTPERRDVPAVVVNDDAIVTMMHGGKYHLYSRRLKHVYKAAETAIITVTLASGVDLIIDRPCAKRETRVRYANLAHSLGYRTTLILFPWTGRPADWAIKRMRSNARNKSQHEWTSVAYSHLKSFQLHMVSESEGWDEIVNYDPTIQEEQ